MLSEFWRSRQGQRHLGVMNPCQSGRGLEEIIEPRRQVAVDEQLLSHESHEIGQGAVVCVLRVRCVNHRC